MHMINKKQFLDGFAKELDIIRHLGTKVDAAMLEYKPTEKQRTMLELMNYLGHIFNTGTALVIEGSSKNYQEITKDIPEVTLSNFDLVMQMQSKNVMEKIEALSDESLAEEVEIFGNKDTRAMHIYGISKWAVAYKMQFFLYIKACGKHDINTSNLWRGVDSAPKE